MVVNNPLRPGYFLGGNVGIGTLGFAGKLLPALEPWGLWCTGKRAIYQEPCLLAPWLGRFFCFFFEIPYHPWDDFVIYLHEWLVFNGRIWYMQVNIPFPWIVRECLLCFPSGFFWLHSTSLHLFAMMNHRLGKISLNHYKSVKHTSGYQIPCCDPWNPLTAAFSLKCPSNNQNTAES